MSTFSLYPVVLMCSADTPVAREGLMAAPYELSHEQADAILALRLGRLTSMEESKLKTEAEDLQVTMSRYAQCMTRVRVRSFVQMMKLSSHDSASMPLSLNRSCFTMRDTHSE